MAWTKPKYSNGQIDRAGTVLVAAESEPLLPVDWSESIEIINNWRSSHSYPLQALKMSAISRARRVDDRAIVAQRLKRLSSIAVKLRRNTKMRLSQMQDLGGCRAIVRSTKQLDRLITIYSGVAHAKHRDYIGSPKADGYRSAHFICRYKSNLRQNRPYLDLIIEVQIRSRLQHAWATAVETVDAFSRQAIKTGGGEEKWRRFFALMSSDIAHRENKPLVPGTPTDRVELVTELRECVKELRVISVLNGWRQALRYLTGQHTSGASSFLLLLDTDANTMQVKGFTDENIARASDEYLQAEQEIKDRPASQAVLVSVQSVQGLRGAFPNYFADTQAFVEAVKRAIAIT
jgi:hypothetical protein